MDLSLLLSVDLRFLVIPALAIMAFLGLLAILSPQSFAAVTRASSQWVDTRRFWEVFDRRIDIDRLALRHSRIFGLLVLAAAIWLTWVYCTQILGMSLPLLW